MHLRGVFRAAAVRRREKCAVTARRPHRQLELDFPNDPDAGRIQILKSQLPPIRTAYPGGFSSADSYGGIESDVEERSAGRIRAKRISFARDLHTVFRLSHCMIAAAYRRDFPDYYRRR
jgi:hypothetical protein